MSSMLVFTVIGIILLLISVLVVLGTNIDRIVPEEVERVRADDDGGHAMNQYFVDLPKAIEYIPNSELKFISENIVSVYKNLGYKENGPAFLKKSWHTWQISLMLKVYKSELSLRIIKSENIFPKELFERSDIELRNLMNNIIKRYKSEVKIKAQREFLINEIEWTGKDMGIILLFLSRYKDFEKGV